jgi:hypothetical protein
MGRCWRACVEEFKGARDSVGVLGALAFVSGLVAIILVGLIVLLIIGALAVAFLPLALFMGLLTMLASRSRHFGKPPPLTDL